MSVFINEFLKCYLTNPFIILTIILGLLSTIYNKKIIGWFGEHRNNQALNKCPICCEKLMEKNGKYGFFGGYPNYPKCRYTKKY